MKVLISTFTFFPNRNGVAEASLAMCMAFLEKGWDVDIATEPTFPARGSGLLKGTTIHEFNISGGPPPRRGFVGEIQNYRDFLKSGNWDVIFFHSYSWTLYLAIPHLDEIKAKKVLVSHGYSALVWSPVPRFPFGLASYAFSAFGSLQMLRWLSKLDCIVVLSKRADFRAFYDHRLARLLGHKNIRIIPNGVKIQSQITSTEDFRALHGIPHIAILFLCVAYYSKGKDQGYAARAFRKAAIPGSVLVFVGTEFNAYSEAFQQEDNTRAKDSALNRIVWIEKLSRDLTLTAFLECDIFILSSAYETQPIAILEAMSAGKPWIARDAGCISEMPGGICVRSEKAMAREMRRLTRDHSLRFSLGTKGREAVEAGYNRAAYGNSYCRLVEELAGS